MGTSGTPPPTIRNVSIVWVRSFVEPDLFDDNVPVDNSTPIYLINLCWKLGLGGLNYTLTPEFPESGFFPGVGVVVSHKRETPTSARTLNLVLCSFGRCTVLAGCATSTVSCHP